MCSVEQIVVTNVKVSSIKPDHTQGSTQPQITYPTHFDGYLTDYYIPTLFVYKLDPNYEEYSLFISRVIDSLQKVLVPFYGFAGRWYSDEHHGRKLVCNGKGVPFIEAVLNQNVESVVEASRDFRPVAGLNGYEALGMNVFEDRQKMTPEGLPPVFVQVTKFNAGGVVLGVTFNHMHSDGQSFFDFMLAWAAVARNEKIAIEPNFDRSSTDLLGKALSKLSPQPTKDTGDPEDKHISYGSNLRRLSSSTKISRTYEVDVSRIGLMKEAVNQGKDGLYISTVDCIVAHAWKCFFQLPDSALSKTELYIATAVEGRKRFFDLPLLNAVGNVLTSLVCPSLPANEIISKPTHELALLHREKLLGTKGEEWFSIERIAETRRAYMGGQFTVSSWLTFSLYEIDFGIGGKPYFSPGTNKCSKAESDLNIGDCLIIPPVPSRPFSAATIIWTCPLELLTALELSSNFLSLFLK